jgi:acyl carrier protein
MELTPQIYEVLDVEARLSVPVASLGDTDDLFARGLSSHSTVNVMLALESAFEVEFPDSMLNKRTFQSIAAIRSALEELLQPGSMGLPTSN